LANTWRWDPIPGPPAVRNDPECHFDSYRRTTGILTPANRFWAKGWIADRARGAWRYILK